MYDYFILIFSEQIYLDGVLTNHFLNQLNHTDKHWFSNWLVGWFILRHVNSCWVISCPSQCRCPWCNGYRRRKWTRRLEFKYWTRLIAFHIALIPLGKV